MADHLEIPEHPEIASFAALGDSFTEGLNDPAPDGRGYVGWADRLAGILADRQPGFRYANLAVRGKLLDQIVSDQLPLARRLRPELISFCAGGNDVLRPGNDPDAVAERFEQAVIDLLAITPRILVFTGFDTGRTPVLRHLRGKIATYNGHLRAIADRHGLPVGDLWALRSIQDRRAWSEDRLHLSSEGHERVALLAAKVLGLPVVDPDAPWPPMAAASAAETRRENIHWAREHLIPWVGRRLQGKSSGDNLEPKRPDLLPL
jgi:lysophospholipase L1-like esterase